MQTERNEKCEPKSASFPATLARCLVDGDGENNASARRSRSTTFGVSLGIETILLALLLILPLLSTVAQPQIRRLASPAFTFIGEHYRRSGHSCGTSLDPQAAYDQSIPFNHACFSDHAQSW
jgi:hypothetical protein